MSGKGCNPCISEMKAYKNNNPQDIGLCERKLRWFVKTKQQRYDY